LAFGSDKRTDQFLFAPCSSFITCDKLSIEHEDNATNNKGICWQVYLKWNFTI